MKTRIFMGALGALLAAGCTTASGPTYNVDTVTLKGGEKVYRAQCQGLFESSNACVKVAQKLCNSKPVRYIQATSPGDSAPGVQDNTRELMFQCGDPEVTNVAPAPQPVPPAPVPVSVPVRKITLSGDANFATGSSSLTPVAKGTLDKFIADSKNADIAVVTISGHTDSTGTAKLNDRLSEARAQSVATYLQLHGLQAGRYEIHGYGSSQPIASNKTPDGRAMNRRVQIDISAESR